MEANHPRTPTINLLGVILRALTDYGVVSPDQQAAIVPPGLVARAHGELNTTRSLQPPSIDILAGHDEAAQGAESHSIPSMVGHVVHKDSASAVVQQLADLLPTGRLPGLDDPVVSNESAAARRQPHIAA